MLTNPRRRNRSGSRQKDIYTDRTKDEAGRQNVEDQTIDMVEDFGATLAHVWRRWLCCAGGTVLALSGRAASWLGGFSNRHSWWLSPDTNPHGIQAPAH